MKLKDISLKTRLIILGLLLAAIWLAGLAQFTRDMMDQPAIDASSSADAIVVLTGGSNRVKTGFDLLDQHHGKKLFISGVSHGVEVRELMAQWKKEPHSELDCCVVLGFEAEDTVGNARETISWMRQEHYTSLYLVTANYHLKRALLDFMRFAPDITIIPVPVAPQGLDMPNWWRDARYRSLIIREYCKYVASLVLYAIPGSPT